MLYSRCQTCPDAPSLSLSLSPGLCSLRLSLFLFQKLRLIGLPVFGHVRHVGTGTDPNIHRKKGKKQIKRENNGSGVSGPAGPLVTMVTSCGVWESLKKKIRETNSGKWAGNKTNRHFTAEIDHRLFFPPTAVCITYIGLYMRSNVSITTNLCIISPELRNNWRVCLIRARDIYISRRRPVGRCFGGRDGQDSLEIISPHLLDRRPSTLLNFCEIIRDNSSSCFVEGE